MEVKNEKGISSLRNSLMDIITDILISIRRLRMSRKFLMLMLISAIIIISTLFLMIPQRTWRILLSSEPSLLRNRHVILDSNPLKLHFIDCDQGDAILVEYGDFTMVVDTGPEKGFYKVRNYLEGICDHIDVLAVTHGHDDHLYGIKDVLSAMPVSMLLLPLQDDDVNIPEIIRSSSSMGVRTERAGSGYTMDVGDLHVEVLSPIESYYDNINNSSLVMRLSLNEADILLTGDLELDAWRYDGNKYEIIKAGHHGSSTSTDEEYITRLEPDLFIISCGLGNMFNHPSRSVVDVLLRNHIRTLRTDLNGTVVISTDGYTIDYSSEWNIQEPQLN